MPNKMDKVELRACLEIPWESCFRGEGRMARRAEGGYPQRSPTEKQRSQAAFSAKTLWAAGLLSVACVGSTVTARCGDAPVSPPWPQSKSLAAGPHAISKQALRQESSKTPRYALLYWPHSRGSGLSWRVASLLVGSPRAAATLR